MGTYVLVHGAWHTGKELEPVAAVIRAEGHTVHAPTIKGNRPGDSKSVGLNDAIRSIADHLNEGDLKEIVLVGHSYGGMIITGVTITDLLTTNDRPWRPMGSLGFIRSPRRRGRATPVEFQGLVACSIVCSMSPGST